MVRVYVTQRHRGKLTGLSSINTSMLQNSFCKSMSKVLGTICSKCYGNKTERKFKKCHKLWVRNSKLLSLKVLPLERLPSFKKFRKVRLHSFGELINLTHMINLMLIVSKNPHIPFALWSKRVNIVNQYFDTHPKPSNLILVYSAPYINKSVEKDSSLRYFDRIFTVFSKAYTNEHTIDINCQKRCDTCEICYASNDIVHVNERIK